VTRRGVTVDLRHRHKYPWVSKRKYNFPFSAWKLSTFCASYKEASKFRKCPCKKDAEKFYFSIIR